MTKLLNLKVSYINFENLRKLLHSNKLAKNKKAIFKMSYCLFITFINLCKKTAEMVTNFHSFVKETHVTKINKN